MPVGPPGPGWAAKALVPLPPESLHDSCFRLQRSFYLDINGDDRMDVVHDAMVKSNTGDFRVEVAIVSLSSPSAPAGYCHSAAASAALAPADLASVAAVAARLATEKKRLGIAGFGCER